MESNVSLQWLEQAAGVMLMLLILLDVFLTALYARANTGIISPGLVRTCVVAFQNRVQTLRTAQGRNPLLLRPGHTRAARACLDVRARARRGAHHSPEARHVSPGQERRDAGRLRDGHARRG